MFRQHYETVSISFAGSNGETFNMSVPFQVKKVRVHFIADNGDNDDNDTVMLKSNVFGGNHVLAISNDSTNPSTFPLTEPLTFYFPEGKDLVGSFNITPYSIANVNLSCTVGLTLIFECYNEMSMP